MSVKIAPSVLSADFARLGEDVERIASADYVHVDIMDGVFVPNISIGLPVVRAIRKSTTLPLDVHLMITKPVRYAAAFCGAGADIVTCHVEADEEQNIHEALANIRAAGKKCGVVLKPATPAEAALPFLQTVDMILVMTVEPGFGGQAFMPDQMEKVKKIRRMIDESGRMIELEADGGIDLKTAGTAAAAGADVLVAGSAVYSAEDIPARIAALRAAAMP